MTLKNMDSKIPGYQAPAVHKTFQLLRIVAESPQTLGLAELVRRLGYSKSTTHGLIHALLREGALAQDSNGKGFYLGPAITDLAFSSWNALKLTESLQPVINDIRGQVGETVFLGGLVRKRVLIMAVAEADDPIKISAPSGTTIPLFAGAVGKVFLAGLNRDQVDHWIQEKGLPRYTPRSITDVDAYITELDRVRRQGYAIDNEEYITGIKAVAAALHNRKGPPMALWIVGLSNTLDETKMQQVIDVIRNAAGKLKWLLEESL